MVDADVQQRDLATSTLQHSAPLSELIAFAKVLPVASRASYLTNIAQLRPSSGLLRYYALTLASIDRDEIAASVGRIADAQQRIDRHERTDLEVTGRSIADAQEAFDELWVDVATRQDQGFGDYKARLEA